MTEEMITRLAGIQPNRLGVIARASTMTYKGGNKNISQIRNELGVDYVVEGSIRRDGGRVRIATQLIEAEDASNLWAQSYDRDMKDILAVQADVALAVARQIRLQIPIGSTSTHAPPHTPDPKAYESYLKGQYYLHRYMRESSDTPFPYFQKAVELDPEFSPGYVGLAQSYFMLSSENVDGVSPHSVMPKAEQAAQKALEMDPDSASAHSILAQINIRYNWDWAAAEAEARRAIELSPNSYEGHDAYADYLLAMGLLNEALEERKRNLEMDPLWPEAIAELAYVYEVIGNYDEAIDKYRRAVQLDPSIAAGVRVRIGYIYFDRHMWEPCIQEWAIALPLNDRKELADEMLRISSTKGAQAAASYVLKTVLERREARLRNGETMSSYDIAEIYARIGNKDRALYHLKRAVDEKEFAVPYIKYNFKSLSSDPRFVQLVRQIGLP